MTNIEINTPLSTIEKLHELAENAVKRVSIDPDVLKLLLLDHSVMFRAISENSTFKIREPRVRVRL